MDFPSIENLVISRRVKIRGSKIGKERTGYKVPFELAFEMIEAIIVDDTAMPIFPNIKAVMKRDTLAITKESNSTEYKKVMAIFIRKTKRRLKISFPLKMVEGFAIN